MSTSYQDVLAFLNSVEGGVGPPQQRPQQAPSVLDAIAEQETRGQPNAHRAQNARTGAHGTYQIMPSNWGPWSKEAFGEEVPKTAENQRAVAAFKLKQYEDQFGPEGAAVAWYAGPSRAKKWLENPDDPWFDRPHGDGSEPSVREYVNGVMGRMPGGQPPPVLRAQPRTQAPEATIQPASMEMYSGVQASAIPSGMQMSAVPFDPEGGLYDESTAIESGGRPDASGHWGSLDPRTGMVLKGRNHPTWNEMVEAEEARGNKIVKQEDGRYYSVPGSNQQQAPPQQASREDVLAFLNAQESGPPTSSQGLSPREQGRQAAQEAGPIARKMEALGYGVNNMLFNVGTPFAAAGEMIKSRLDDDPESFSFSEARDYIHGEREGYKELSPKTYAAGNVLGLAATFGGGAAAQALRAPTVSGRAMTAAKSVFAMRKGNYARAMAASGAVAGGASAGFDEGLGGVLPGAAMGGVSGAALGPLGYVARGAWRQAFANRQWATNLTRTAGVSEATRLKLGIDPDGPAIRKLAKSLKEPPEAVAEWYNRYKQAFNGESPTLAQLMERETVEEIALIAQAGRGGSEAAGIFRNAQEAVESRIPGQLSGSVRGGGPTTTAAAETQRLAALQSRAPGTLGTARSTETAAREALVPVQQRAADVLEGAGQTVTGAQTGLESLTADAAGVAGQRTARTAGDILGFRDIRMTAAVEKIRNVDIPLSTDMHEYLAHPDIQEVLPGILRRKFHELVEQGETRGQTLIPVKMWDDIRQALSDATGSGAYTGYSAYLSKVKDYVNKFVPEYGQALEKYIQRSNIAEGARLGSQALTRKTRNFRSELSRLGGGTADTPRYSPRARIEGQAGARMGVRNELLDELGGTPERAAAYMERLSKDPGARASLRAGLSPDEAQKLEALASEYGHQLRFAEGVAAGSNLASTGTREALEQALSSDLAGAAQGMRGKLAGLLETPEKAGKLMETLARNTPFRQRVTRLLSNEERSGLEALAAEYGQKLKFAEGVTAGRTLATRGDAEALAQALRSDPGGVGQGLRGSLAGALESPEKASKLMERLARDEPYRQRVLQVLSATERRQLDQLSSLYGQQLDAVGGAKVGETVMKAGSTERFQAAVADAYSTPGGGRAQAQAARGTVADIAAESPGAADYFARAASENPGLQRRLELAFGRSEAGDIVEASTLAARSGRNMDILAPASSEAVIRAKDEARAVQTIIGAAVVSLTRKGSAAMKANVGHEILMSLRMSKGTVKKTADMLVDPNQAPQAIRKLLDMGATPQWILQLYQKAAVAAGILVN